MAVASARGSVVALLLQLGSRGSIDLCLNTPLHFCTDVIIAKALMAQGLSCTACNQDGNTPRHYAAARGSLALMELFSSGVCAVRCLFIHSLVVSAGSPLNSAGFTPEMLDGAGVETAFPFFVEDRSLSQTGGIRFLQLQAALIVNNLL